MKNKVNSPNLIEILGKVVLNVSHLVTLINESNKQGQILKADSSLSAESKKKLFRVIKDTPLAYMTKYVVIINPDLIRSECMPAGQREGVVAYFHCFAKYKKYTIKPVNDIRTHKRKTRQRAVER